MGIAWDILIGWGRTALANSGGRSREGRPVSHKVTRWLRLCSAWQLRLRHEQDVRPTHPPPQKQKQSLPAPAVDLLERPELFLG